MRCADSVVCTIRILLFQNTVSADNKYKNRPLSTRKCYGYDWVYATLWLLLLGWWVDEIYNKALKHDFGKLKRHGAFHLHGEKKVESVSGCFHITQSIWLYFPFIYYNLESVMLVLQAMVVNYYLPPEMIFKKISGPTLNGKGSFMQEISEVQEKHFYFILR